MNRLKNKIRPKMATANKDLVHPPLKVIYPCFLGGSLSNVKNVILIKEIKGPISSNSEGTPPFL